MSGGDNDTDFVVISESSEKQYDMKSEFVIIMNKFDKITKEINEYNTKFNEEKKFKDNMNKKYDLLHKITYLDLKYISRKNSSNFGCILTNYSKIKENHNSIALNSKRYFMTSHRLNRLEKRLNKKSTISDYSPIFNPISFLFGCFTGLVVLYNTL